MTSPTRQEIIEAHDSLKEITGYLDHSFSGYTRNLISDLLENVRDALPPRPQPTMADVEWDDNEHCLAEAEHPTYGPVIMIGEGMVPGTIHIIHIIHIIHHRNEARCLEVKPSELTPTGHRYVRAV